MDAETRARLERLLVAARRVGDARDALGVAGRERLAVSTGLSAAGIELAFERCLEVAPSEIELESLVASAPRAPRALVVLSASVFVAAHRALALALAAAPEVVVRPSRREPHMARLLAEGAPGLFRVVDELAAAPGDLVFAYGGTAALASIEQTLPAGTTYAGHGPGVGLVALHADGLARAGDRRELAERIALDTALFDQRGCLSPRLVLVEGDREAALAYAEAQAGALAALEARLPLGALSDEERAETRRYRDSLGYAGTLFPAASGFVGVGAHEGPPWLSPVGRSLHVLPVANAAARAREIAEHVTTFAAWGSDAFVAELTPALPMARATTPGLLQSPPLDGPVDRRTRVRPPQSAT